MMATQILDCFARNDGKKIINILILCISNLKNGYIINSIRGTVKRNDAKRKKGNKILRRIFFVWIGARMSEEGAYIDVRN
jgi:hypothetical protein